MANEIKSNLPSGGAPRAPHGFGVKDRAQMQISGVDEVISFDEESVALHTSCGAMTIEGKGLHITTLNIERGEVVIDGTIGGVFYTGDAAEKTGIFGRIFG